MVTVIWIFDKEWSKWQIFTKNRSCILLYVTKTIMLGHDHILMVHLNNVWHNYSFWKHIEGFKRPTWLQTIFAKEVKKWNLVKMARIYKIIHTLPWYVPEILCSYVVIINLGYQIQYYIKQIYHEAHSILLKAKMIARCHMFYIKLIKYTKYRMFWLLIPLFHANKCNNSKSL